LSLLITFSKPLIFIIQETHKTKSRLQNLITIVLVFYDKIFIENSQEALYKHLERVHQLAIELDLFGVIIFTKN